jgi:hypothetical protein
MPSANSLAGVGGGLWWFRGRMNGLLALDGLGDAQRQQPRPVARNAAVHNTIQNKGRGW